MSDLAGNDWIIPFYALENNLDFEKNKTLQAGPITLTSITYFPASSRPRFAWPYPGPPTHSCIALYSIAVKLAFSLCEIVANP